MAAPQTEPDSVNMPLGYASFHCSCCCWLTETLAWKSAGSQSEFELYVVRKLLFQAQFILRSYTLGTCVRLLHSLHTLCMFVDVYVCVCVYMCCLSYTPFAAVLQPHDTCHTMPHPHSDTHAHTPMPYKISDFTQYTAHSNPLCSIYAAAPKGCKTKPTSSCHFFSFVLSCIFFMLVNNWQLPEKMKRN